MDADARTRDLRDAAGALRLSVHTVVVTGDQLHEAQQQVRAADGQRVLRRPPGQAAAVVPLVRRLLVPRHLEHESIHWVTSPARSAVHLSFGAELRPTRAPASSSISEQAYHEKGGRDEPSADRSSVAVHASQEREPLADGGSSLVQPSCSATTPRASVTRVAQHLCADRRDATAQFGPCAADGRSRRTTLAVILQLARSRSTSRWLLRSPCESTWVQNFSSAFEASISGPQI